MYRKRKIAVQDSKTTEINVILKYNNIAILCYGDLVDLFLYL